MKKALIIILLISCQDFDPRPIYNVDEKLEIVLRRFIDEAHVRGVNVMLPKHFEMYFEEIEGVGVTLHRGNTDEWKIIKIHPSYKDWRVTNRGLEWIVFHELGHALLDKRHVSSTSAIMYRSKDPAMRNYIMDRDNQLDIFFSE